MCIRYPWILTSFLCFFWVTAPRLDNVTNDHCHSRLCSQIFPVSRNSIILTVCFGRKRTLLTFWAFWEAEGAQKAKSALFLAKQTYEKWHHFFALAKICSVPAECQWRLVTLSKRGFRARVKMYLAATAQMYLVLRPKWTWPQILPPVYSVPIFLCHFKDYNTLIFCLLSRLWRKNLWPGSFGP